MNPFSVLSILVMGLVMLYVARKMYQKRHTPFFWKHHPPDAFTIMFDFDGTIADTYVIVFDIMNLCAQKYGYKTISKQDYERFRGMDISSIAHELGISLLRLPLIITTVITKIKKRITLAQPYEGISESLLALKKDGYYLGIITSNSREAVQLFLKKNNLAFFDFIYTVPHFFNKADTIHKALNDLKITAKKALYVGDEKRDIEAAHKNFLKIIAVTWGYNDVSMLEKCGADYSITHARELYPLIKRLTKKNNQETVIKK
jgi:phosphoglycolate phosphatase